MTPHRPLRIAVCTNGRFHLCDLARELSARGHDVRFYSIVPPWRTKTFGLPARCNRWLLPRIAHWYAAAAAARGRSMRVREWAAEKYIEALDRAAAWAVEPCDVFIGMSGMFGRTAAAVRRKFGAKVWVERASRHVLSQQAILERIAGADQVPAYAVGRELADYALADTVNVPSRHCERSFLDHGHPANRLTRNPFGVRLDSFPPTPPPPPHPPTVIMTGTWSLRKGCDVLTAAWRTLPGVKLVHVGPVADCPLPTDAGFVHHDKVDQRELTRFYATAHVFALASREEGLAFVQPQALASGLRLVCTDRTGGEDLSDYVTDSAVVRVVRADDPERLATALRQSLADATTETGVRDRLGDHGRANLSWAAYAARYEAAVYHRL